jgi:hypothetical protein
VSEEAERDLYVEESGSGDDYGDHMIEWEVIMVVII